MELVEEVLQIDIFLAITLGIIVLFVGKRLNTRFALLQDYSIPDPVTGGLLFALLFALFYAVSGISVEFNMQARDFLLVYFFTTIGINASFGDLRTGGKPLVLLIVISIAFLFLQNTVGVLLAGAMGRDLSLGLIGGSVSLMGGYGTAIAWAPKLEATRGISSAMEVGIACATFGLILASTMGGPIAKHLIKKHGLEAAKTTKQDVGFRKKAEKPPIGHVDLLDAILAIHFCIIIGSLLDGALSYTGFELPLFVSCLFAGILVTNLLPDSLPRLSGDIWPDRTPAMSLIAEISLGTFLAMSLMSLQLWKLAGLAGPIFLILLLQFAVAVLVTIYVVFPLMGRSYDAAIICAGFGGISLGSTPTAMANMASVTQRYGASHMAFVVVPLVCAFFLDLANAVVIPLFLKLI
ncbi:MAG: sodium/glutamate symporter [Halieaceae bacterium]